MQNLSLSLKKSLTFSLNHVRSLSTTSTTLMYNKRGHFRSPHLQRRLNTVDSDLTYMDFLGPQFGRQYGGFVCHAYPNVRATVIKFLIRRPLRPNSGNRRFAKVKLTDRAHVVIAKIPHEGHTLQEHSIVKATSGKQNDCHASWWELTRGRLDFAIDQPGKKFFPRNRWGIIKD